MTRKSASLTEQREVWALVKDMRFRCRQTTLSTIKYGSQSRSNLQITAIPQAGGGCHYGKWSEHVVWELQVVCSTIFFFFFLNYCTHIATQQYILTSWFPSYTMELIKGKRHYTMEAGITVHFTKMNAMAATASYTQHNQTCCGLILTKALTGYKSIPRFLNPNHLQGWAGNKACDS